MQASLAAALPPAEPSQAVRALAHRFRSIHLVTGPEAGTGRLAPAAADLARWLGEDQAAFAREAETLPPAALRGLPRRTLSIAGPRLLEDVTEILALCRAAEGVGLAAALHVGAAAFAAYPHAIAALREAARELELRVSPAAEQLPPLAWHIDQFGDIYPRPELLGHEASRLGSIHQPFERLLQVLAGAAPGRRGPGDVWVRRRPCGPA